jgi:uroporphyrinogen decarboxylase
MLTHRERVLRTLRFKKTDRVPYDLMEGAIWPELMDYFRTAHGLESPDQVYAFLDADFRWCGMRYVGPEQSPKAADESTTFTKDVSRGPLADAETVADVESHAWPDPSWWQPIDYAEVRRKWPDHALVYGAGWKPLFWGACEAFGMEQALIKILTAPRVFDACVRKQHTFYMDLLARGLAAARGTCDICWLGDDFCSQQAMMIRPDAWRVHIRPYLAEQVRLAREHDMYVLYHSCGAVRPILPDLIDIGVNALLVFQTRARGMDAQSIARDFGGKIAFYGGIDVQQLLSYGTVEEVQAEVKANVRAFADCGGYIVANSHHKVATIKGDNVVAMCRAASQITR